jgi:transposase-like protein
MRGVAYDPVFRAKMMALHQQGVPLTTLSADFGVSREVLGRWWARYRVDDLEGLQPRSRRPHESPSRVSARVEQRILKWRGQRLSAVRIAWTLHMGHSTVQRVLERHGQNQLPRPARPKARRYEKQRPGELVHIDLKYLPALRSRSVRRSASVTTCCGRMPRNPMAKSSASSGPSTTSACTSDLSLPLPRAVARSMTSPGTTTMNDPISAWAA